MIKKTVIWVCVLVFVVALPFSAFADQSIGYRQYFNEGVKYFKEHDDQKALRSFKIAEIYDPADKDLQRYLAILSQRGLVLQLPAARVPPEKSVGYRYYFSGGIKAFEKHNDEKAIRYFKIALIFNPASKESGRYLRILYRRNRLSFLPENPPSQVVVQSRTYLPSVKPQPVEAVPSLPAPAGISRPQSSPSYSSSVQPQAVEVVPQAAASMPVEKAVPSSLPAPAGNSQSQSYSPLIQEQPQQASVTSPAAIYIPEEKSKQIQILSLDQITSNGLKPRLQIAYQSSVIIAGKNIQRFLVVTEGFIGVKITDPDHLQIDGLRIGTTFLHIWDASGRHTLYIEVIFPKSISSGGSEANGVQHSLPFIVTYANDWNTYYSGRNVPKLERQSYELDQSLAVKGETPYGMFDSSVSYNDFSGISEFDYYTIGLSQIPVEGTSNFNLRGFDALRYLSPLTMPSTRLRGAFADVDLLGDNLGLSVSHGQVQQPLGFIPLGGKLFLDDYVDAVKLTLFPKSDSDQYSFNFASAYGPDQPGYLTDHVYSIEGQHKFNDFLTLNAEEGSDSRHTSTLASLGWLDGNFRSGLNFRNIDKDYSTISSLPANQGETGAVWTTDADYTNFEADSFLEAYQDHLDPNPDDPHAFNYDGNGHLRANMTPSIWSDSDINFSDTQGELSPNSSLGLNERISKRFGIWNSLQATVFGGTGYQHSHSSGSDISDYDREDVIAGIQLPLTHQLSAYTNYEYDWLNQPDVGNSNPSIVNVGFEYQKQVTQKLSFTSQLDYHDELGVKQSSNSFLSGEQSVIVSSGFNYNPTPDINFFGDIDASNVLSHIGNPSYDDFEAHVGVKITFGGATYWDPLGTVSGIIFKDRNGSGRFVPGDEGVQGVKVKVGDKETITDKYGRYRVQIRAKGVDVVPVLDTIPGGLIFSTPQALNVQVFQGRTSHADFGLISQTGIYGIIFVDRHGATSPNEGDKFIGKVRIVLDDNVSQRSDSHGAFYFRKVSPGEHTIAIDINTLSIDMVPLIKLKSKIDVAEGTNYMFNVPIQIKKQESQEE